MTLRTVNAMILFRQAAYAFGIYCSDYINPLIAVLSLLVFTALCFISHMYKKIYSLMLSLYLRFLYAELFNAL